MTTIGKLFGGTALVMLLATGACKMDAPGAPGSDAQPPSDLARAEEAMKANEPAKVRAILEKKVMAGQGSPEEVLMYRGSCRALHDTDCIDAIKAKYPKNSP